MTFADKAIKYFSTVKAPQNLPEGICILNPYSSPDVMSCVSSFYKKYFDDNNKRIFIWGINPGRFGGGLTGISFTDPVALKEHCGIENNLGSQKELSSKFIYDMINSFGGAGEFFSSCYLTALYPLAIIKDNTNYNFYDEPRLYLSLKNKIAASVESQVNFGADKRLAVCLGKKNYKYFKEINDEYSFFERIEILEHPRYIMQYKLKKKEEYIEKYLDILKSSKTFND
jgi:hypothetical protein